jgi:hypothetical protein
LTRFVGGDEKSVTGGAGVAPVGAIVTDTLSGGGATVASESAGGVTETFESGVAPRARESGVADALRGVGVTVSVDTVSRVARTHPCVAYWSLESALLGETRITHTVSENKVKVSVSTELWSAPSECREKIGLVFPIMTVGASDGVERASKHSGYACAEHHVVGGVNICITAECFVADLQRGRAIE